MNTKKAFASLCAIGVLTGCGEQVKTLEEAGYVPVSRETVKTLPPQPIEVIYGYANNRLVLSAVSPLECFEKSAALYETRKIDMSGEEKNSPGKATCMGNTGVVMMVHKGQAYVPGTLSPPKSP